MDLWEYDVFLSVVSGCCECFVCGWWCTCDRIVKGGVGREVVGDWGGDCACCGRRGCEGCECDVN